MRESCIFNYYYCYYYWFCPQREMKWHSVIQNKLIRLTQTAHFGMSFYDHQVVPTSPLTHHTCSQNHARLTCSGRLTNTQCLQCEAADWHQRSWVCVCERKLFWVSLCIAAGSGALKLLNDRTRPSLSGRRWAMHACHLYTAVSFIWSSSLSLVAPPPQHVPSYSPQSPPSCLPFCNCSGIYWQRPEWSSVSW